MPAPTPLASCFGSNAEELAPRTALLSALSHIGIDDPSALVNFAKESSALQQVAQTAAIPEVSSLGKDKQSIALLHLKYERILRSALTEA
ncbi:hypothetical protein Pmar_PMAR016688, partial [Perkinsus marinus ATCC 50983]